MPSVHTGTHGNGHHLDQVLSISHASPFINLTIQCHVFIIMLSFHRSKLKSIEGRGLPQILHFAKDGSLLGKPAVSKAVLKPLSLLASWQAHWAM